MYFLKRFKKKGEDQKNQLPISNPNFLFLFREVLALAVLVSFNIYFLWPYIGSEYPLFNFSAPVLPLLARIIETLTPLSFMQGVGIVVLASFPLASVTWYFFLKRLSGSVLLGFISGLIFLLPWFYLPRFALFWQRGDGIHALGFAILPLAGILYLKFLRSGSFNSFLTSFFGVSLISLVSPFALLNLYLLFLILTFTEMLLGQARLKILRFLAVCLFAQSFSAFWYHPRFLTSLFQSSHGQEAFSTLWKLFPISFFTVPVAGAFSFLLFDRKPNLQPLLFALLSTSIYLAMTIAENFGEYLVVSTPDRFFPEFYIGLSFLLTIIIAFVITLPKNGKLSLGKIHPRLALLHHSSEIFLTSIVVGLSIWPVFSFFSETPVVPALETPQVLGVQSGWWMFSRDGVSQMIGFAITLLTASTSFILKRKIKT